MMEASGRAKGGCGCGAVRYVMNAMPMIVHACHCTDCQRITGSAFALNACIERTQVAVLSGEPVSFKFSDHGRNHRVYFCAQCGTHVWTAYSAGVYYLRVGALDDPGRFGPDMHIWTRSKQPWLQLPGGVRVFEKFYDRNIEWPAASLTRLAAALA